MLQKRQVIVTSLGCCGRLSGVPSSESPNCWSSYNVRGKMGQDEMEDERGMVIDNNWFKDNN